MKTSNIVWDAAALGSYIHDPKGFLPGNKMAFPGLKNEPERTNVIAYLASLSAPQEQGAAPAQQPQAPAQPAPQPQAQAQQPQAPAQPAPQPEAQAQEQGEAAAPAPDASQSSASYIPDVRYTLRSGIAEGRMVFLGVGGAIDAQVNPMLSAAEGQVVQITLLNGEGAEHDVVFPDFDAKSPRIVGRGSSTTLVFRAGRAGDFLYICSVPGHQLAGMEGQFVVTARPAAPAPVEADISQKPTEVPPPINNREPQRIRVDLLTVELEGRLAEGTTFGYWTFNGRVPGPMIRVRVGDTLEVHLKNGEDSGLIHSVDFHAATGPGGGAAATQADPGQEKSFKFKALVPGLYVYHCATPMVAHHIANGMYGLILVEPEGGLPPVDREFYVMQGEIYTQAEFGQHGPQEFSVEKLLNERPEYFVFNGAVGALSKLHTLKAKVGETVRIYFGVGGPNYTSSFHVIGEIFDRVYNLADVMSPPARGIQTVTVPAGGATIVEFKLDVPGNYILVDHALSRAERGLIGILHAEGPPNPEIFEGMVEPGAGH
jgi:nitrite reductase (NO-forming)